MFDTHAHVNFNAFKNDSEEILQEAEKNNLGLILVGSQFSTSERAKEMAERFKNVYAAIGLHPIHLEEMEVKEDGAMFKSKREDFDSEDYKKMADNKKVVAIGETGLDYFHLNQEINKSKNQENTAIAEKKEKQKKVFIEHIKLADELKLPMILHCRGTKENIEEAYADMLEILKENMPDKGGVLHCYVGPMETVKTFLDLGFYFGFNGIITFDKTGKLEKILKEIPENRILAETDCPYLAPVPYRGKRNEPKYVEFVVKKIAEIKGWTVEKAEKITDENARNLFVTNY
ncbi:MAG: TatD family hydrolase [Parcubacteria group bacterium]